MKKIALTALAAMIAATGFVSTASADSRNRNDDEWRRHSQRDGGDWNGRREDRREARRDHDRSDEWRHHHRRDHWRWRHDHGPRVVFRYDRPDYCFVKKVRVYDDWGNLYIKRVRVCR